jgi:hypothetical protein
MQLNEFRRYFKREVSAWNVTDEWILFKRPLHLWNVNTDEEIPFKKLDDCLDYKVDNITIREYIEKFEYKPFTIDGGRGSKSGTKEFRFTSASDRPGGKGENKTHYLHPAYLNVATKERSFDSVLKAFGDKYRNADHEYGAAVDDLGYTYRHVEGNASSVSIWGDKGQILLHNHPSGGNFSKADMQSIARGREKGIVASGKNGDFIFMKGKNFNATAFEKAMLKARPRGKSYDDAIGNWLKSNAKKYGYTYEFRKLK